MRAEIVYELPKKMLPKFADWHAGETASVRVVGVPSQVAPPSPPNWFRVTEPAQCCVPEQLHEHVKSAPVALV